MTGSDLTSAISRLEQVTERLLRFEASLAGKAGAPGASISAGGAATAHAAANGSIKEPSTGGAAANGSSGARGLAAYDKLLEEQLKPFMAQAMALGGEVLDASKLVEQSFQEQRTVLLVASKAKQPDVNELQQVLQPVAQHMMAAGALADNRRSQAFNQVKMVAECLHGLSWLAYTGPNCGMHLPAQHIAENWNSAEFYSNKLLKEFRGVDDRQVSWAKALKDLFTGLQAFVRINQPTGLTWNPAGTSLAAAQAAAKSEAPAAATGAPAAAAAAPAPAAAPAAAGGSKGPARPPPAAPPPPANLSEILLKERPAAAAAPAAAKAAGGGGGLQDVLKALNQGTAVTSGLRKVTDDMKSKNRADRSGHVAVASPAAAATAAKAPAAGAARGPARIELEQERKWVVENQVGQKELVVTIADPKHSVYIYNCSDSVVQVKGKCNAISIDKCQKTGVVFEDVIASCEFVNCGRMQVQCTGTAPTLSIDKCDGVQAYIPAALAADPNFQVVTAKSSEINLLLVAADPSAEDVIECPVPEQFISTFNNGKLVTTAASHGGG